MAAPKNENIKSRILQVTEQLLESKSFQDISLAQVAAKAEISKGTLYYYYKSKGELFCDLTDQYLHRQWEDFLNWTEDDQKDTSLQRLVKYVIERNVASAAFRLRLFGEAQLGDEELKQKLAERYNAFYTLISEKIAQRTNLPAEFLTWLILLASDGIIIQKAIENKAFDADGFVKYAVSCLEALNQPKNQTENMP